MIKNQTFTFECSVFTYLDCVEKNLFGSSKPWPLEIKKSRKATTPCCITTKSVNCWGWGGMFPHQVKVKLVIPMVTDVPKKVLEKLGVDPARGTFDNCVVEDMAEDLVRSLLSPAS